MEKHSGYTMDQLQPCYHVFESLVRTVPNSNLKAVYKKFKSGKYFEVARLATQVTSSGTGTTTSSAKQGSASANQQQHLSQSS